MYAKMAPTVAMIAVNMAIWLIMPPPCSPCAPCCAACFRVRGRAVRAREIRRRHLGFVCCVLVWETKLWAGRWPPRRTRHLSSPGPAPETSVRRRQSPASISGDLGARGQWQRRHRRRHRRSRRPPRLLHQGQRRTQCGSAWHRAARSSGLGVTHNVAAPGSGRNFRRQRIPGPAGPMTGWPAVGAAGGMSSGSRHGMRLSASGATTGLRAIRWICMRSDRNLA